MGAHQKSYVNFLLIAWWLCGALTTVAGFGGGLHPVLSLMLIGPLGALGLLGLTLFSFIRKINIQQQWLEVLLLGFLIGIWLIHATSIFVPETGFDAVWYHLPIVDEFTNLDRVAYLPTYYQSVNPLFADLIFLLGYQVAGELGAKVVAYGLMLSLIIVSYEMARWWLNRFWSLLFVIQVSLIQVVTWQSSSFYVDGAKALWEVASLYFLLSFSRDKTTRINLWLSALFFGASLATKQFSVALLPIMVMMVFLVHKNFRWVGYWVLTCLMVSMPFYLHSGVSTGDPFFAITTHLAKVEEIGSNSSLISHLTTQVLRLPYAGWYLIFEARDYVSPLLLLLLPFAMLELRVISRQWVLLIFSISQLFIWWFIPPVSTRYALSGFITLLLLLFIATAEWIKNHPGWKTPIILGVMMVSGFLLLPRLYVVQRSLPYLIGQQDKHEYLQQFLDGNIDYHLKKWHQN